MLRFVVSYQAAFIFEVQRAFRTIEIFLWIFRSVVFVNMACQRESIFEFPVAELT